MFGESDPQRKTFSYGTIQSDPKGQFRQFVQHIENSPEYDRHLDRFSKLCSDMERIHYATQYFTNCIDILPVYKKKSDQDSNRARLEGNELFKQRKFAEALHHFNKSVMLANSSVSKFQASFRHN